MESNDPKISVLMTVYNSERYLRTAIESVLNQSLKDFELIILDDCSTDSSWSIIEKYASQDERIVAIKNEVNLGGCQNLNKGLKILRGKYMARHDNDDWSYPDRLERQFNYMESHPEVGIVGGAIELIDKNGKTIGKRTYNLSDLEIRKKIFRYSPFAHPLVMVRKSVLDKVGCFYDPSFAPADDYDLWFRIGKESKFANLPDTLLKYRMLPGSITFSSTKKMEMKTIDVRRKYVREGFYRANWFDRLYNFFHQFSIGMFPSKMKISLYNFFRNE